MGVNKLKINQHKNAITNPQQYYKDYSDRLSKVKGDMKKFTETTIDDYTKKGAAQGYPDTLIEQYAARDTANKYQSELALVKQDFPDIEIAATQIKNTRPQVIGVRKTTKKRKTTNKKSTTKRKSKK